MRATCIGNFRPITNTAYTVSSAHSQRDLGSCKLWLISCMHLMVVLLDAQMIFNSLRGACVWQIDYELLEMKLAGLRYTQKLTEATPQQTSSLLRTEGTTVLICRRHLSADCVLHRCAVGQTSTHMPAQDHCILRRQHLNTAGELGTCWLPSTKPIT